MKNHARKCLALALLSTVCPAKGQFNNPSTGVSQAQLNAVSAAIPTPIGTVPLGPLLTGNAAPADNTFVPGSAAQRQGVMRTNVLTDASGNWSVTWNNGFSFLSSTPTVTIEASNPAGANFIGCNWRTRSSTGATGFCQQTNTALVSLLGITITVAPTIPTTGTPITVIMAEPTQ